MPTEIKMIIKNGEGESKIIGKAITLPTPKIFPQPFFIRLSEYTSEGNLWDNENFEFNSGKVECNGEDYDLAPSTCSLAKFDEDDGSKKLI
ncbi:hypothetical protein DDB_G0291672 [Dictyostelium discoideum AX4]|nr:hypothetical protein DDB_G0291672 [Dictyostelium discoideum AX4]EAL61820.1 hypothetical protein DDB_G0291672 [Dictyostelium discoideum AX4]|eukprot:XP_635243.1 hypothetical protein DDB_G0291672 [Dictyostelium discoideum AX4]